ncbi:hypothetical protein ANANG_G00307270 [Anguilla anguilla]|uniref:Uncharacterized protein n=1 Tax=Anguilla anguilla TaxID=7936 RepID=A0A9D3LIZ3_ANGAN|nr:hypothetical protein ANANG_G00307270 [Anguilla anguilla]
MAVHESMVVMNGTQISYIGHDCEDIPEFLGERYGRHARRLDLSFNLLRAPYREVSVIQSASWERNLKQFPVI